MFLIIKIFFCHLFCYKLPIFYESRASSDWTGFVQGDILMVWLWPQNLVVKPTSFWTTNICMWIQSGHQKRFWVTPLPMVFYIFLWSRTWYLITCLNRLVRWRFLTMGWTDCALSPLYEREQHSPQLEAVVGAGERESPIVDCRGDHGDTRRWQTGTDGWVVVVCVSLKSDGAW